MAFKHHYLPHLVFLIVSIIILSFLGKSAFMVGLYSLGIVVGALILTWAGETAEIMISEGLALAIIAWLQVLPEFSIEAAIAWAGDISNLLANFTGANRLLIGFGWPLVFFTTVFFYWKRHKKFYPEIKLEGEHSVESIFLLISTCYFFIVYAKKSITIADSIILIGIYVAYLYITAKLPHPSRKKVKSLADGIPKKIINLDNKKISIMFTVFMFVLGGGIVFMVAKPFYHNMLALAATLGISQFLFIQWVAPFLSEFPEKASAFHWASKIKTSPLAIMNLISSKITQWTLLVGIVVLILVISPSKMSYLPISDAVNLELLLTIMTSLYASVFLMKLSVTWGEMTTLLVLWLVQFFFVSLRPYLIPLYMILIVVEFAVHRHDMWKSARDFKNIIKKFVVKV